MDVRQTMLTRCNPRLPAEQSGGVVAGALDAEMLVPRDAQLINVSIYEGPR
jgi:hypothetical protein